MANITIEDVALEAGVSITTVSRVMNNNYPVREETRKRVEAAIEKLNFAPNVLARGLIQKKTYVVGVVVPSITNLYFSEVVNGAQEFLSDCTPPYQILLCDSAGDAEQEAAQVRNLTQRRVDGIISFDPRTTNIKSGFYSEISSSLPLVLTNAYNDGIKLNFVLNDQESGTVEALDYLIGLGHTKISFIRGRHSYSYDLKEETFRNTLKSRCIIVNDSNIIVIPSGNSSETVELTVLAVQKRFSKIPLQERPTAILACNDFMGIGALHAAQAIGIRVPEELSVIGFDNTLISQLSIPKLTTVDQNMRAVGMTAAQILINSVNSVDSESKPYTKTVLNTKLIKRGSCSTVNDN